MSVRKRFIKIPVIVRLSVDQICWTKSYTADGQSDTRHVTDLVIRLFQKVCKFQMSNSKIKQHVLINVIKPTIFSYEQWFELTSFLPALI